MNTNQYQIITLGGGCFWCLEAVFERVPGVISATSGYAGGTTKNPTYKEVCNGDSGHAEVIQITFDPAKVSLETILEIFWQAHDPTTPNRQGADIGTQYRSVILFGNENQKRIATKSRDQAQKDFHAPIVTEIAQLENFHKAEEYHQGYFDGNTNAPYCRMVISPKIEKLEKKKVIQPVPQVPGPDRKLVR